MSTRRRRLIVVGATLATTVALVPAVAQAASDGTGALLPVVLFDTPGVAALTSSGASTPDAAVGVFHTNLLGVSVFTQAGVGQIRVQGSYSRLVPGAPYFTVIYGNTICDPAQAFPVGPFYASSRGTLRVDTTVASPIAPVRGTGSVSVRHGDTAADLDGDGKVGPTDVVAVAGQPSVGLVECDNAPLGRTGAGVAPPTGTAAVGRTS